MRAFRLTLQAAWQASWANRRGFWTSVTITLLNDVVWVVFWVLFFRRVGALRGWDVDQVMLLFAVLTTSAGLVLGLFNNVRRIGELASTGGLDAVLALPTPPLVHLLGKRIETVNVGDLAFGLALFAVLGRPTPMRALVFVFGVLCASLVMGGFLVLVGSTGFVSSRGEAGELGFHAILLFSNYPVDVFSGPSRLFLYAVVPAGFVTSVPVRLMEDFDVGWATALLAVGIGMATAGWAAFTLGLRRYTSGAVWTGG